MLSYLYRNNTLNSKTTTLGGDLVGEQKEFYTLEEAGKIVNRNRATIYNRMKLLGIKPHKFHMDRKAYVTADELKQIKEVIEKPWIAGERGDKNTEDMDSVA
jgi:ribonuclease HI